MSKLPDPAVIEIVEKISTPGEGGADSIIVPTEIRINGHPVLAPDGYSVKVHEMEIPGRGAVVVTLTLFAKRITVSQERPEVSAINVPLTASGVQVGSANFPLTVEVSGDGPVRATLNLGEPDIVILGFDCPHDDCEARCISVEGKVGDNVIPVGSLTVCKLCYPELFPV